MAVTVDTNILIWGIRGVSTPGQESRIPICRRLFEWLRERQELVVLTADCVEEYLVGGDSNQLSVELIRERFIILDYNPACWLKSAEIRSHPAFMKEMRDIDRQVSRVSIRADVRIVATAIAHNVEKIYSDDSGVRTIASRSGLLAVGVPTLVQMERITKAPENMQTRPTRLPFPDQ